MHQSRIPLPPPADLQIPGPEQVLARLRRAATDRNFLRAVMGDPVRDGGSHTAPGVASRPVPELQHDDFANMRLERIIHGVAGPRPIDANAVDHYRLAWQRAGATLAELYEAFDRAVANAVEGTWQGAAGGAAAAALADYVRQTSALVEGTQATATQLRQLRDAMADTSSRVAGLRQALAQARTRATAGPVSGLVPGLSADSVTKAVAELQRDAQQVMTGTYRPAVQAAYTGMPALGPPHNPASPQAPGVDRTGSGGDE